MGRGCFMRLEIPSPAARAALDSVLARQFDSPPAAAWMIDGSAVEVALTPELLAYAFVSEQRAVFVEAREGEHDDDAHAHLMMRVEGLTELLCSLRPNGPSETPRMAA